MYTRNVTDLSDLAPGETGVVQSLSGGPGIVNRLAVLGFTPGGEVTVLQNYGRGPMIVLVRNTRVALGRREARKVQVQKLSKRRQS